MATATARNLGAAARLALLALIVAVVHAFGLEIQLRVALHAQSRYVQHRWVAGSEITTRGLQTAFALLAGQGGHTIGSGDGGGAGSDGTLSVAALVDVGLETLRRRRRRRQKRRG